MCTTFSLRGQRTENFIAPHLVLPTYGYRNVKYDVQNHPSLNLILKQLNPVHNPTTYLSKTSLISFSIKRRGTGLPDKQWNREKKYLQHLPLVESSKICCLPCTSNWDERRTLLGLWTRQALPLDTSLRNSQELVLQKSRRVFPSVHRSASSTETFSQTAFSVVNNRRAWIDFWLVAPTFQEKTSPQITRHMWTA